MENEIGLEKLQISGNLFFYLRWPLAEPGSRITMKYYYETFLYGYFLRLNTTLLRKSNAWLELRLHF